MGDREPDRKLFVGGLDHSSTEESLKEYFSTYGQVEVKLSKDPQSGRSRGFAFLVFQRADIVDQVQTDRPHTIDGRNVGTRRVLPKDPNGIIDTAMQVKKLFVGGIKGPVEEEDLRESFSPYGKIVSISIPTDKTTGKQKGFVFIEYDDCDCVDKAFLKKDEIQIKGNFVDVKKAFEKDSVLRGAIRGGRGGRGGFNRGAYDPYGGPHGYDPYDSYGGGYDPYCDGYRISGPPRGSSRGGYSVGRGGPRGGRGGSQGYGGHKGGYGGYDNGYGDYESKGNYGDYESDGYGRGSRGRGGSRGGNGGMRGNGAAIRGAPRGRSQNTRSQTYANGGPEYSNGGGSWGY